MIAGLSTTPTKSESYRPLNLTLRATASLFLLLVLLGYGAVNSPDSDLVLVGCITDLAGQLLERATIVIAGG
ncbi:MAG: hypothetical protein KAW46_10530 [candidate division Zixibacteria bacterium]|nr:hypothetical protein [candidate division Zixibacteria bacterium]